MRKKFLKNAYKLYLTLLQDQLKIFFDYLKNIRNLILFIMIFVAITALLIDSKSMEKVPVTVYWALSLISIFIQCVFIIMAVYWWIGNKCEYRDNIIIPGFLAVFGGAEVSIILWFSITYSGEISSTIQEVYILIPIVFFGFFCIINYIKLCYKFYRKLSNLKK